MEVILAQLPNNDKNDWFKQLLDAINLRYNRRIPRGGWSKIREKFNHVFNESESLINIKNQYNKIKAQMQQHQQQSPNIDGDNLSYELAKVIKDGELFKRTRQVLLANIEKYSNDDVPKQRTGKVYSAYVNNDVIEMINAIITKENIPDKIRTIKKLNDILYACQKTYDERTRKIPIKSAWKESIEKKYNNLKKTLRFWKVLIKSTKHQKKRNNYVTKSKFIRMTKKKSLRQKTKCLNK